MYILRVTSDLFRLQLRACMSFAVFGKKKKVKNAVLASGHHGLRPITKSGLSHVLKYKGVLRTIKLSAHLLCVVSCVFRYRPELVFRDVLMLMFRYQYHYHF